MRRIGYRIFKLHAADLERRRDMGPRNHNLTRRFTGFALEPVVSGGGWANPDGTFNELSTAEAMWSAAMANDPESELIILPVYKAQ